MTTDPTAVPTADPTALYDAARRLSHTAAAGFYNDNVRLDTPGGPVIVRIPIAGADGMDLRVWPETAVLAALRGRVAHVPELLHAAEAPAFQVHRFVDGDLLDRVAPRGVPVPPFVPAQVAELFVELGRVPAGCLPVLPAGWPAEGDAAGFAGLLSDVTAGVHATFRGEFGGLFAALGVPAEPLAPVLERWATLTPRPFQLLHCDVHRKNMIVGGGRVVFLDWELALWGDPVYDLAVHLHKMGYRDDEAAAATAAWVAAMPPERIAGWAADVPTYLAHERVKSAVVDAVRYAKLLADPATTRPQRDSLIDRLTGKLRAAHRVWGTGREPSGEDVLAALAAHPASPPR